MKKQIKTFQGVGILLIIAGLCFALLYWNDGQKQANKPAPTVTVTATPSEKKVVPQACLDALDEADGVIKTAGEAFAIVADIFRAVANLDVDEMTRLNKDFEKKTSKIGTYNYAELRDQCRAESEE